MSVQNEPDYLRRSMLAGAREFSSKPFSLDELVESIRHVHQLVPVESARRRRSDGSSPDVVRWQGEARPRSSRSSVSRAASAEAPWRRTWPLRFERRCRTRKSTLVDGNLLYGDIGVLMNVKDNKTIADIVRNFNTLDRDLVHDILVTHSSGVKVLLAPPDPQAGERVTARAHAADSAAPPSMVDYIIDRHAPVIRRGDDDVARSLGSRSCWC